MLSIRQARSEKDREYVRELFWEYLEWANARLNEGFNVEIDIETMLEEDMASLDIYFPPDGRLLLAIDEDRAAGIACLKRLRDDIGEIKRM
jgi:hypothetical protein